jgi:hypothetical protein
VLGKPLVAPGIDTVSRCLAWSTAQRFILDAVEIAPDGKLCLNRKGGLQIQLGTGVDLDKKLNALGVLLQRKPDLRDTQDIAYVNLFAYEAPAIMSRAALASNTARQAAEPRVANDSDSLDSTGPRVAASFTDDATKVTGGAVPSPTNVERNKPSMTAPAKTKTDSQADTAE